MPWTSLSLLFPLPGKFFPRVLQAPSISCPRSLLICLLLCETHPNLPLSDFPQSTPTPCSQNTLFKTSIKLCHYILTPSAAPYSREEAVLPKPAAHVAVPPNSSAPGIPASSPCFHLALPQNGQSQTVVQPVQGAAPPATVGAGAVGSVTHSPPTVAQPHMTLVSSPLPVGQSSLTLPPSTPQPVFLSHGVPLNQAANPPVLPLSQPVGPVNKSVGTSVLPISQTIRPGVLPLSQPVGPISRPVGPGVLSVNRPVGSGVLPVNPSVTPGVLQAVSPGVISVSRTVPSGVLPAGQVTPAGVIPSGQTATSGVLPAGQVVQSGVLPIGQTAPS